MRVVSHPLFSVPSPDTILGGWTLEQLVDAHRTIDLFDELDAQRQAK